jgi:outer membrane receptor protein involved in Fe transport
LKIENKRNPIARAVRVALLAGISAPVFSLPVAYAEEAEAEDENKITVTGSRLKKADIEGAAPITVITAEDIEANGFTTAFEALSSIPQVNGSNQGAQDGGTFTQGADSINLRAVGPGRTLTLVNGRRIADYPLPFNGQSNIRNVANIPSIMIERIEILSSGASAIYGSDAVAGVVNIILKDNMEGMLATVRLGDTHDGGGESYRLQLSGGVQDDNLDMIYGIEYFNREPIMAFERDYIDSFADNPDVINGISNVVNSRSFLILDPFNGDGIPGSYVDPGAAACEPLSNLAGGSVEYSTRPGAGNYCGTAKDIGFNSIRNAKNNFSAYLNGTYQLDGGHELFSTLIYTSNEVEWDVGTNFWQYETGLDTNDLGRYFVNSANTDWFGIGGQTELWQRIFTVEEVDDNNNHSFEDSLDLTIGARGQAFGGFDYDFSLSLSKYDLKRERRLIDKAAADLFFVGPVTGTVDFGFGVWNIHNAPSSNLYRQLTTEEYNSISGIDTTNADSQNFTSTLVLVNDEVMELPAGPVGLAVVFEAASQEYTIDLDPKLINREWFGYTGTGGGGERDRSAVGLESSIPLMDDLNLGAAVRWDKYDDATNVDDAITYNLGLEYRPFDNLLLRATKSTSFRAPDMHFVYADPSGFFTSATDQYLCRRDQLAEITTANGGADYSLCNLNISSGTGTPGSYGIGGARQGSTFLEEEEGESTTVGFVYNITDDLSVTLDYYKIEMTNVVRDQSIASLLELEANCRLGQNFAGTESFDGNSAECQNAYSLISRNGVNVTPTSELINSVTTGPINAALRETRGYDMQVNYRFSTESMGDFTLRGDYNHVVLDQDQQFAGDDIRNLRDNMQIFNFRSSATASLNWRISDFSTTLFAVRTGSVPNWAETERCCINIQYNASVSYQATDDMRVSLFVKDLRNKSPQVDPTFNSYPYYFTGQYDAYGREYSLQFDYRFGQ